MVPAGKVIQTEVPNILLSWSYIYITRPYEWYFYFSTHISHKFCRSVETCAILQSLHCLQKEIWNNILSLITAEIISQMTQWTYSFFIHQAIVPDSTFYMFTPWGNFSGFRGGNRKTVGQLMDSISLRSKTAHCVHTQCRLTSSRGRSSIHFPLRSLCEEWELDWQVEIPETVTEPHIPARCILL